MPFTDEKTLVRYMDTGRELISIAITDTDAVTPTEVVLVPDFTGGFYDIPVTRGVIRLYPDGTAQVDAISGHNVDAGQIDYFADAKCTVRVTGSTVADYEENTFQFGLEGIYNAPALSGSNIADINFEQNSGDVVQQTASAVTGQKLVFSYDPAHPSVSITPSNGDLLIQDDTVFGLTITVSVTNERGDPAVTFPVNINVSAAAVTIPVVTGALANQSFVDDTGIQTYDASVGFTGTVDSYALIAGGGVASINPTSGVVSFDTDALAVQAGTTITVEATNVAGSVSDSFTLDVTSAPVADPVNTVAPTLTGTPQEGQTLTGTEGTWTGSPTLVPVIQWSADGSNPITETGWTDDPDASPLTFEMDAGDITRFYRLKVTGTNASTNPIVAYSPVAGPVIAAVPIPILSALVVDEVANTISITSDIPATLYWRRNAPAGDPDDATIIAGGGFDSGSFDIEAGANVDPIVFAAGNDGLQQISFVAAVGAGTPSNILREDVDIDTVDPVLTSPTDTVNGQTASTGSVSTDEGAGTLYFVVTESATPPNIAQIIAGQDNTGTAAAFSASQAVTATGIQATASTGLAAGTAYTTHFMHEDDAGNRSAVVSASGFTTDSTVAGATVRGFFEDIWPAENAGATYPRLDGRTLAASQPDDLMMIFGCSDGPVRVNAQVGVAPGGLLVENGFSETTPVNLGGVPGGFVGHKIMTATPDATVNIAQTENRSVGIISVAFDGVHTDVTDTAVVSNAGTGTDPASLAITTVTPNALVLAYVCMDDRVVEFLCDNPAFTKVAEIDASDSTGSLFQMMQVTPGTIAPLTFTQNGTAFSEPWMVQMIALKAE